MLTLEQRAIRDRIAHEFSLKGDDLALYQRLVELHHDFSPEANEEFEQLTNPDSEAYKRVKAPFAKYQDIILGLA